MSRTRRTIFALAAATVLTVLGVIAPAASAQAAPASLGGDFCRLAQNTTVAVGTPVGGTCPD
ncbi:hypothetical protein [Streptomyces hesseae]|uniref:Chaplin domain-containing protein n=1 Tax=Streptomyces hesseae TaxID=3075519 RepID=A0ABU2SFW0_9ACTN|nr:hypothetical protein [Streptomyces sp. DSM 40473]MDT0447864.1 hypothetical protein [Streptomyces sp. DSM 40473]